MSSSLKEEIASAFGSRNDTCDRSIMFGLIIVIAVWGIVHSLLASLKFKEFLRRALGDGFMRFYRLMYNLFAAVSFLPVLYLMVTLPDQPLYHIPAPWRFLMLAGQGLCAMFLLAAILQTDALSFAGLRQLFEEEKPGRLVTDGLYRFVRHPLYTFGLLALWLSPTMTVNSFIVYAGLTIYILLGITFEERKLLRLFGQDYAHYKSMTPMLVPGLKFGGNK